MTGPASGRLLSGVDPGELADLLTEARRRARDLVMEELTAELADAYRRGLHGALPQPVAAHIPTHVRVEAPDRLSYVYCVCRRGQLPDLIDLRGLDGARTRAVPAGDVSAVVSDVAEPVLRAAEREPDLAAGSWLADAVRAHERVVEQVFRATAVLPSRFGAVYPSDRELSAALADREGQLLDQLQRLTGFAEVGVKAFPEEGAARGTEGDEDGPPADGAGWLWARHAAALARTAADTTRREVLADLEDQLTRLADRHTPVTPVRLGGDRPYFSAAYLLASEREPEFRAAVAASSERATAAGMRLDVTGPWPPYHFVEGVDRRQAVRG